MERSIEFPNLKDMKSKRNSDFWHGVGSLTLLYPETLRTNPYVRSILIEAETVSDLNVIAKDFAMVGSDILRASENLKIDELKSARNPKSE